MIVDCPYCKTSNSGSTDNASGDTGVGSMIVCRGCGRRYHAPNQASEVGGHTTQVAMAEANDPDEHSRPTTVFDLESIEPNDAHTEATRVVKARGVGDEEPTTVGSLGYPTSTTRGSTDPEVKLSATQERTGVMMPDQLDEQVRAMRDAAPGTRGTGLKHPLVVKLVEQAKHQWARFMKLPMRLRALSAGGAGVLLLIFIALCARGSSHAETLYLVQAQALLSELPRSTGVPHAQGTVPRGAQVTLLESVGNYATVRDMQGRVGYVPFESLTANRPGSQPDAPFVDCQPSITEGDTHGCEARAEEQWDACEAFCEKGSSSDKCASDCRSQYKLCKATCNGEAPRPEPTLPEPAAQREPAAAQPKPESRPPKASSKPASKPKKSDKKHKK